MLRSLMTGVTGVRAHQTMLDVVGNNVANVNTTGFKKSMTVFQDLLYQSSRGATAPGDNRGGINPLQVGLGVIVAGVEMVNTAGPLQITGNRTDMAITGDGYYVLSDGMNKLYSRAGNFSQDGDGILVHVGTGFRVQGYQMMQDPANPMRYITDASLSDIKLKIGSKMEARETSVVGFRCNLNSTVGTYLNFGISNMETSVSLRCDPAHPYMPQPPEMPYLSFSIKNVGSPGDSTDAFATYEIDDGYGNLSKVILEIGDIIDGKPRLMLSTAAGSIQPGNIIPGTENSTIAYDDKGILKIVDATTGREFWRADILSGAKYSSFTLQDKTNSPALIYDVLVEFDRNDNSSRTMEATLWVKDPVTNTMMDPPVKLNIPMNPDGTFNIPDVGLDIGPNSSLRATNSGDFPAGTTNMWDDDERIIIKPAADGRGIEIQAVSDAGKLYELNSLSTILQDMTATHSTKLDIFDCQGVAHTLEVVYKKVGENTWRWEAFFPKESDLIPDPTNGFLKFGPCGKLVSPDSVTLNIPYSITGSRDGTVVLDFSGKSFGYDDAIDGVTQYGSATTTKAYYQDGYAMGEMNDFSVAKDGTINGRYTNGKTIPLYRIALATFDNPAGLERVGSTSFRESANSGMAQIGLPMEGGAGEIEGGNLEMSNVDISEEFTRLILAQRGFQANARIVTVSDSILEELVNLKR